MIEKIVKHQITLLLHFAIALNFVSSEMAFSFAYKHQ